MPRVPPWEREREFFIVNLLVGIHFITVMNRWTGLAPWEFEFSFGDGTIAYGPLLPLLCSKVQANARLTVGGGDRIHLENARKSG